ncbi:MAG: COX15/CtaA family protein [Polyangiales bacterium]
MRETARFQYWSMALLGLTVLVILWGAFVRVTGSGAGCADHWPLCNGELVPRSPRVETLIELTHRVTSSLAGLLSIGVFVAARRGFERGSPVRKAAGAGLLLMLLEGAIGALLVKQGLVAKNTSEARAFVVALHLCNTFLLLGAQTLTVHFARGGAALDLRGRTGRALVVAALLGVALLLGASGAVTALGDTLFPSSSLRGGLAEDLAPGAHFLVRLRVLHPLLAVIGGAIIVYVAQQLRASTRSPAVRRWAQVLTIAYAAQLGVGALNLVLLAPMPIQLMHLALADVVWVALVLLGAHALAAPAERAQLSLESAAS